MSLDQDPGKPNAASWRWRCWTLLDRVLDNFTPARLAISFRARMLAGTIVVLTAFAILALVRGIVRVLSGL
jgi:hypothetical protein